MKWNELGWKLQGIHGNSKRIHDNIGVKVIDKNGMLLTYTTKVVYKEDYSEPDKDNRVNVTGQYLEVVIN